MLIIKKLAMAVLVGLMISIVASPSLSEEQRSDFGDGFLYDGFKDKDAIFRFDNGVANITDNGILRLTGNSNSTNQIGHAFYTHPFKFKSTIQQNSSSSSEGNTSSSGGNVLSFSTTFIFSIIPENPGFTAQGIAFVIAPQAGLPGARETTYLGLFNSTNNGQSTNHVLAVELDTFYSVFDTIEGEHVGININDLRSVRAEPSGYYLNDNRVFHKLSLVSGDPIQVWIDYDGVGKKLNVTLAPINMLKPSVPLISYDRDLSDIILQSMYVGFSSSTSFFLTSHYIMGWSFKINGTAPPLNLNQLPKLPRKVSKLFGVELPIIIPVLLVLSLMMIAIIFTIRDMIKNSRYLDVVEDWEINYRGLRFSYKDLYIATNGFKEKELLGSGGFGQVYEGILPTSKARVAVKRISHNSRQGEREFISEIISIDHLRHRNLAHLLGYCRRDRELLLVYDYMPNGSLDKLLFRKSNSTSASPGLDWNQRFQIIKGIACALIYLHEDWEQVVVHRDIKASNVLLDREMNARLGDFGLARLYDRGTNPERTNVAGTFGYIAPEMIRTGKATTSSDVFAFGVLLLEIACGRRPTELHVSESEEGEILVDWVFNCWRRGALLQTCDPNLGNHYNKEEMELVLKLGLVCSHNDPKSRPRMRQVMQYLEGELPLPQTELWALDYNSTAITSSGEHRSYTGSMSLSLVADSLLSGPR